MGGDCDRKIFPGPRRNVLSCALAPSCSQRSWQAAAREAAGASRGSVIVVTRVTSSSFPSRSGTSYSMTRTRRALAGSRASPARAAPMTRWRDSARVIFVVSRTEEQEPSGSSSSTGSRRSDRTRHSSAAPVPAAAHQSAQL
jgi:hypothetical protein